MVREGERIWKDFGKGKKMIKAYLNLKIVLNKKMQKVYYNKLKYIFHNEYSYLKPL